ncbi:class II aldolase/adducin family protein [Kribbella sp. NPDC051936]|uniref:class II aldolase/adducin family protein n=1 Tax=Kribbella sp. NPDC051936 TaxID=3154946 RepID=UPI00341FE3DC
MVIAGVLESVDELRRSVADLTDSDLNLFTTGIVSARVPGADLVVIKPPGVSRGSLSAESVVVTDLSGKVLDGVLARSADGDAHAYVYRTMPEARGVVNTRSTVSIAWAGRGEPVPHVPTIADGFDGQIPVGPAASSGESIGHGIVGTLQASGAPAALMRGRGLFTIGPNGAEAVRLATLLEHRIRTVHIARQLGTAEPLNPHDIDWLRARARSADAR